MTRDEFDKAVSYIHGLADLRVDMSVDFGLERFAALCEKLGNPQNQLRAVHIGGTNGKGSTTAMVSSILRAAGYKVGTYYSPYVYNIRERVQLDCTPIDEETFVRLVNTIKPHAAAVEQTKLGHPTEFEVKTALGLLYFAEQEVDFAVLEVGMGGRLDATNIVNPLVSVITNVGMDHMERLGNTIAEIAAEKAGIVKQHGHLVTAASHPDALAVIRQICEERNCTMWRVYQPSEAHPIIRIRPVDSAPTTDVSPGVPSMSCSQSLCVEGMNAMYSDLILGMQGEFQHLNAATAIGAIEVLQRKGVQIPESSIRMGLRTAYLPGRLEVLQTEPTLLIDGAHNPDGARTLARALQTCFKYDRLILVMGMVSGHSIRETVAALAPLAEIVYATAPQSTRAMPASEIAEVARMYCDNVLLVEPVSEAVAQALENANKNDLVCVTGSFYTIGEVPRPSQAEF